MPTQTSQNSKLLCATWSVLTMIASAAAWQWAADGTQGSAYPTKMLATGAAEAAVSLLLGSLETINNYRMGREVRAANVIVKPAVLSLVMGALWQPMVDIGGGLASICRTTDPITVGVFSSISLGGLYALGLYGLKRKEILHLEKPFWVTAVLSEILFYLAGPLPLPGVWWLGVSDSPSGNRNVFWAAVLAGAGALGGEMGHYRKEIIEKRCCKKGEGSASVRLLP